jgi:hypothetical protein
MRMVPEISPVRRGTRETAGSLRLTESLGLKLPPGSTVSAPALASAQAVDKAARSVNGRRRRGSGEPPPLGPGSQRPVSSRVLFALLARRARWLCARLLRWGTRARRAGRTSRPAGNLQR